MGVAYLALDESLDRLVAIKVLRADDTELRKRFEREARTVGRFQHPNIVTLFEFAEDHGQPFIAMEYVAGETLKEKIARKQTIELGVRLELMEGLCDGLAYAHARGVIHRDVKPANLIIERESDRLRILDFGIAKAMHTAGATLSGLTAHGGMIGTPNYMSPEQAQGKLLDARPDVFAVGLVLYETLSYRQAFPGTFMDGVTDRIVREPPPPLRQWAPHLDSELVSVTERAIEKVRSQRYQDVATMRADLTRIRQRLGSEQLGTTVAVTPPRSQRRRPETSRELDHAKVSERREIEIQRQLRSAREALGRGDFDRALDAAEQAALVSPEDARIADLVSEIQTAARDFEISELLAGARRHLQEGALTKAVDLVTQALQVDPDHADAKRVHEELLEAQASRERDGERARQVERALGHARDSLQAEALESALRGADEVLAYEPENQEAEAIRQEAQQALREREDRAAKDRRARDTVELAHEDFAGGQRERALELLEAFRPTHPLISEALTQLRQEQQKAERQELLAKQVEEARGMLAAQRYDAALQTLAKLHDERFTTPEIDDLRQQAERGLGEAQARAARMLQMRSLQSEASAALTDGELTTAKQRVDAALELEPDDRAVQELRAQVDAALETRRIEEARQRLRRPAETGAADAGGSALRRGAGGAGAAAPRRVRVPRD